jgi:hypothetical protein
MGVWAADVATSAADVAEDSSIAGLAQGLILSSIRSSAVLLTCFTSLHVAVTACVPQVVSKVDEFKPQELANVVWALASMEHYNAEVMEVGSNSSDSLTVQFQFCAVLLLWGRPVACCA